MLKSEGKSSMRRRQRAPDSMYGRCIYIYMINKDLNDSLNIYNI